MPLGTNVESISLASDGTLYALLYGGQLQVSTNSGSSWNVIDNATEQYGVAANGGLYDLDDGGAHMFGATIRAIRARTPMTRVEVLIPDCKGEAAALDVIFDARPDVLNHNLETVARLQRAARPSAGYARSLSVLARAKDAELVTKSGLIVGMGEEAHEVRAAIADLRAWDTDRGTPPLVVGPTPDAERALLS